MTIQPVRGTHDILQREHLYFDHVVSTAKRLAAVYGFEQISTPIFEFQDVFCRTLGETSDVVSKEMYTFDDRSGEKITLRPEGTASVVRAMLSNGLMHQLPYKAFYAGPMFRYERPQKGRQRQFHQVGVELLGVQSAMADAEVILMADHFLQSLELEGITLQINTLGDLESRAKYREALVEYLSHYKNDLSNESKLRLEKNPLRILDSKNEKDQEILVEAPKIKEYLTAESSDYFDEVLKHLESFGLEFVVNPLLVRGLDYYTHTTFEFITDKIGAQGTVLAGGRYDGISESMGGNPLPSIGWAAGVERLMLLIEDQKLPEPRCVSVIPADHTAVNVCFELLQQLRVFGIYSEMAYEGNFSKRMKRANKIESPYAVIVGEKELHENKAIIRNFEDGKQIEVPLQEVLQYFMNHFEDEQQKSDEFEKMMNSFGTFIENEMLKGDQESDEADEKKD